jgi:hypothetical protein
MCIYVYRQIPTQVPTGNPTTSPTLTPSAFPTRAPSQRPTKVVDHASPKDETVYQILSVHSHDEVFIVESVYVAASHAGSNPPTYPRLGTSLLTEGSCWMQNFALVGVTVSMSRWHTHHTYQPYYCSQVSPTQHPTTRPTTNPTQAPTANMWDLLAARAKRVQESCSFQSGPLFGPLGFTFGRSGSLSL